MSVAKNERAGMIVIFSIGLDRLWVLCKALETRSTFSVKWIEISKSDRKAAKYTQKTNIRTTQEYRRC